MDEEEIMTSNFSTDTSDDHKEAILADLMRIKGVGKSQAEKLYNAQIYSCMQLAGMPIPQLMDRTGFNKKASETLIANAKPLCDLGDVMQADALFDDEINKKYLSTGSKQFDELLGGGYPTKLITEIHAENGIGKTQASFTASVICTRPIEEGGLDGHVVYIDTEGTFNAHRVAEIATERGYDPKEVLSKIHVARVMTSSQQVLIMDKVNELATEFDVKLIVVDSIMARFRSDFAGGRQNLPERQGMLNQHLAELMSFANRYDSVILITNQMSASPDAGVFFDPMIPIGGNVLGHASAIRVRIRRGKNGTRIMKLIKSNTMPVGECAVTLDERGIGDKE